jgi:hypothetical protein
MPKRSDPANDQDRVLDRARVDAIFGAIYIAFVAGLVGIAVCLAVKYLL